MTEYGHETVARDLSLRSDRDLTAPGSPGWFRETYVFSAETLQCKTFRMSKPSVVRKPKFMSDFIRKLRENYESVEARIGQACTRAGRERDDVTLVAVTKYAKVEWIEALAEMGVSQLGENHPQQLIERATKLSLQSVNWHLIGHLQTNKVKSVIPHAPWIHSVDSEKLYSIIGRRASELCYETQVLLEVNVTGEATKYGFSPDELRSEWKTLSMLLGPRIRGLMTMAEASDDPENARPAFRTLRNLRDELRADRPSEWNDLTDLSMGMTGDFEVAIEEGATFVRIGSALFEGLE